MKVYRPNSTGFKELAEAEQYYKEYTDRCMLFVYENHCNGMFFSIEDALQFSINKMVSDGAILILLSANLTCETAKVLLQAKPLYPSVIYYYQKRGNKFTLLLTKHLSAP